MKDNKRNNYVDSVHNRDERQCYMTYCKIKDNIIDLGKKSKFINYRNYRQANTFSYILLKILLNAFKIS